MNEHLRDEFHAVIPEPPSTDGWMAGVRRKRRNRQMAMGGVAVALALAVALPAALLLTGDDDAPVVASPEPTSSFSPSESASERPQPRPTAAPSPSATAQPSANPAPTDEASDPTVRASTPAAPHVDPSSSVAPPVGGSAPTLQLSPASGMPGAAACYNEDGRSPLTAANTGGELPTGVARAYLCGDVEGYGVAGPMDALIDNPDQIVEAFRALPGGDTITCESYESGDMYRIVLEYANGDKRLITGYADPCVPVTDGTTEKDGASFLQTVMGMWVTQRANQAPASAADAAAALTCHAQQSALIEPALDEMGGGVFCSQMDVQNEPTPVQLSADLVRRIASAAAREAAPGQPADGAAQAGSLVLTNAYGDILVMERFGDGYLFRGETEMMLWTPSQAMLAEIDAAVG